MRLRAPRRRRGSCGRRPRHRRWCRPCRRRRDLSPLGTPFRPGAPLQLKLCHRRMSMPLRKLWLVAASLVFWNATALTQPQRTRNVVLVTLDGVRWQEMFGGMDEALLRATTAKDTDITTLPVYKQYSGATPRE